MRPEDNIARLDQLAPGLSDKLQRLQGIPAAPPVEPQTKPPLVPLQSEPGPAVEPPAPPAEEEPYIPALFRRDEPVPAPAPREQPPASPNTLMSPSSNPRPDYEPEVEWHYGQRQTPEQESLQQMQGRWHQLEEQRQVTLGRGPLYERHQRSNERDLKWALDSIDQSAKREADAGKPQTPAEIEQKKVEARVRREKNEQKYRDDAEANFEGIVRELARTERFMRELDSEFTQRLVDYWRAGLEQQRVTLRPPQQPPQQVAAPSPTPTPVLDGGGAAALPLTNDDLIARARERKAAPPRVTRAEPRPAQPRRQEEAPQKPQAPQIPNSLEPHNRLRMSLLADQWADLQRKKA